MDSALPKIGSIPRGEILVVVPPNIEAVISGVQRAGFDNAGVVTLVYKDGTREAAQFTREEAQGLYDKGLESIFPVVSAVQGRRAKK